MKNLNDPAKELSHLRQMAEMQLRPPGTASQLDEEETQKLIHELEVHQIELEMQLGELTLANQVAESASQKHALLFDFAPSGYFILSNQGEIVDVNLSGSQMLGKERSDLLGTRFDFFVDNDTKQKFNLFLEKTFNSKTKESCEITLLVNNNQPLYVQLEGIHSVDEKQCLLNVIDITERKNAEESLFRQQQLLSKLTQFSIDLSKISSDDNLEKFACKKIKEFTGAVGVLFSEYDEESRLISPKHIELEPGLLSKVVNRLENQIQDMSSMLDDKSYLRITQNIIGKYDSLTDATFGTISRPAGAALSLLLKAGRYIGISYMVDGKLYGTSLLVLDKNQPDPPIDFLENIASLIAISLRRKRAETDLKISLDRNKALLGANPDLMVVFDPECRIIDFRTESNDNLYVKPELFLNKTIDEVFPPDISLITHQCVNAVLSTGKPDYATYELPSGNILRSYESRYVLCGKNEILAIVRDITEKKWAEEALLKRKQQYDNLVSKIPVGVYILHSKSDGEFALDYASPRMAEMLNLSVESLLTDNNSIFKAIHPDDLDGFRTLNQEGIYQNRPFNWVGRVLVDGNIKWMHFRSTPETLENGEILWHGLIVDITERKQAEQEIKLKNDELSELIAEKDRFFSLVAHDLRGPFNVLLGLTQMLDDDLTNMNLDEIQSLASALKGSALSVYNLLENLLEWSRIKRGAISFNPESFLLSTKIDEFLQPVLETAYKKSIEISYSIPDDLVVFADLNMMGSIIRNLTSNAVKFTQKNGSVFLSAQITGDKSIEISVRDSGIGMKKSILNKLFNFDKNNNRRGTDGESSSGLGLIICKEFVEKHGGRIWAKSMKEKGSTFYLILPHEKRSNA